MIEVNKYEIKRAIEQNPVVEAWENKIISTAFCIVYKQKPLNYG